MQDQIFDIFENQQIRQKLANRHDEHNLYARPLRQALYLIWKEYVQNCELWNLLKKSLRIKQTNK